MRIAHQIKNVIQVLAKMLAMLKLQIHVRIPNTQHVQHGVPRLHIHAHVITLLARPDINVIPVTHQAQKIQQIPDYANLVIKTVALQINKWFRVLAKMLVMLKLQIRVRIPNTQHVQHGVPRLHIHAHVITLLAHPDINVIPVTHQAQKIQQIPDYANL